ncbi:YqzE family protein [Ornithinibacillus xuwenensis]|uniref:YqzE family protein n=1 Tax=Ornithinibacillus xuwenensis TaxID=3144668 RepID=A0ABU9XD87_9BACI
MKGNDYVKFMTQQVVSYMDLPKEERKKRRTDIKAQRNHLPIGNRWFGVLPVAIKSIFKRAE